MALYFEHQKRRKEVCQKKYPLRKIWLLTPNFLLYFSMWLKNPSLCIARNVIFLFLQFCERIYPGGIMLLYSVVLSRTFDVIMKDMGQRQKALLTDNARSTQVPSFSFSLYINIKVSDYAQYTVRFHAYQLTTRYCQISINNVLGL